MWNKSKNPWCLKKKHHVTYMTRFSFIPNLNKHHSHFFLHVSYNFIFLFTAPKESLHQKDKDKNTKDCRGSRKLLFEEYMFTEDVSAGLKRGELLQVNFNTCKLVRLCSSSQAVTTACSVTCLT